MAKVALLIGVSEYEVGLNPLPAAVKDVVALERILKDSEMGDFDEVKILTNPEPQTMQYEVETLFSNCGRDDFVLLFFSGHGIKDEANNLYFATRITKKSSKGNLIKSTAVPAKFIHDVMNGSRAKRQAIILDCCFSGAFDPSLQSKDDGSINLQEQLGAEGRVVLTSSSSTQYSFEQQGSDLSLYTRYLIEGIETGAGDLDEDGKVSVRELHEYATSKVQETAPSITPKLITLKDLGFDLVLAKAKVTDPNLRYRRQVEKYSKQGKISPIGRTILNKLQSQLCLSPKVAGVIEIQVLLPYQERLDNLHRYRQSFAEAIKTEYPFNNYVKAELEDLLQVLGLRREDVEDIEQATISESTKKLRSKGKDYRSFFQNPDEGKKTADRWSLKLMLMKIGVPIFILGLVWSMSSVLIFHLRKQSIQQPLPSSPVVTSNPTSLPSISGENPFPLGKPFIIQLSSDAVFNESEDEVKRIQDLAEKNMLKVAQFKTNNKWYVTTVGSFFSEQEANQFLNIILNEIPYFKQTNPTVEDIKKLCPKPVKLDKYWECKI
jgi:uncharacterized caspase-like protein